MIRILILKGIRDSFEAFHKVKITDEAIVAAVRMSSRYISDRFLPDKAIDLIDEACSDLNLKDPDISRRMQIQRELDDYEKERMMMDEQVAQGMAEPDYERMAFIKSKEMQLHTELDVLLDNLGKYRAALVQEDEQGMKELLKEGRLIKEEVDKVDYRSR